MTSIARYFNRKLFGKKVRMYFWADLFLLLVGMVIFTVSGELASNNNAFFNNARRQLVLNERSANSHNDSNTLECLEEIGYNGDNYRNYASRLEYRVTTVADGNVVLRLPLLGALTVGAAFALGLWLIQIFLSILGLPFEKHKIRNGLKPINEIAAKADELSRIEFDESKYHLLEEKITSLSPEESLTVSPNDKELEGIEIAINSLLKKMRDNNMQQARFVNDASHELRTPIAVIEGYANMLVRWGREDEKVLDESITAIAHEASHMKYLVEQLLFLARGDSGKTVLHPEKTVLNDMMREIYEESLMIDEQHVYRFSAPEEPICIDCDPALLKQAVRILVDNAAKYTNERDEITISTGLNENQKPYLQVQDSGIGMEQADVIHMFERFYRADDARSFSGTGLGLSIAKWIVDKHGGHFEVLSRVELGTRIRIVLPMNNDNGAQTE